MEGFFSLSISCRPLRCSSQHSSSFLFFFTFSMISLRLFSSLCFLLFLAVSLLPSFPCSFVLLLPSSLCLFSPSQRLPPSFFCLLFRPSSPQGYAQSQYPDAGIFPSTKTPAGSLQVFLQVQVFFDIY